jgi:hypothetical protein
MADSKLQSLMNMVRIHLDWNDLTPEQRRLSSLRVAKVLQKLLDSDRSSEEEVKERAKVWVRRAAYDPQVRKMFRESSEADVEAFFRLPEQQQWDIVAGVPKPVFTQLLECMRAYSIPQWEVLRRQRHSFGWSDLVWIGIMVAVIVIVARA